MITDTKAKSLMRTLIRLRNQMVENPEDTKICAKYKTHEALCIQQFKYVIDMHADRYRQFCNYEDLVQDGYISLLYAMKSYDPSKGSFFYWAHRYIRTRIKRMSNIHSVIRFPLSYAKQNPPRRENNLPVIIDTRLCPDKMLEEVEISDIVKEATGKLDEFHKNVVSLYFGLGDGSNGSLNKVCKKLKISKEECIQALNDALVVLKENIEI